MLDLLEDLHLAAALIDEEGRIIDITSQAAHVDGFSVWTVGKRPQAENNGADDRLWDGLDNLLCHSNPKDTGSCLFVINSTRTKPIAIKAVPIRNGPLPFAPSAKILLLVIDLDMKLRLAKGTLRSLFRLTPAESRLSRALLDHCALEDAATSLNISIGTARQQLKSVFHKTGVSRQSELLSLLSRIAVLGEIENVHRLT